MSIDFVQLLKSPSGIARRFAGVSIVEGRIPMTLNRFKYVEDEPTRKLRARFRLVFVVAAFPVVSPNV